MKKNYPLYDTTFIENMRSLVENSAEKFGDKLALSYKLKPSDKEVVNKTYNEFRKDVRAIGTALVKHGFREKAVALVGENSYLWCCSFFAIMAIGSVVVPVDKELAPEDIAGIINKSECEAVIFGKTADAKIAQMRDALSTVKEYYSISEESSVAGASPLAVLIDEGDAAFIAGDNCYYDYEIDADKLASIVFTSGTTGKGKGVMLSQNNIGKDMTCGMYNFAISEKTLHVLPPHHTFGSTVNYVGHLAQGVQIYISSGLKYVSEEIKEQQPTHLILVPAFVEVMYKKIWTTAKKSGKDGLLRAMMGVSNFARRFGLDVRRKMFASVLSAFGGKLEFIICGGAKLDDDIIKTFDAIGITILNGYGITECAPLISANRNKYQKKGSVGTPIIGCEVKIANPDENGEGEICVKGPNVMLGYFKDSEATSAAFDEEGFFRTGDYGKLDDEGWIYITGRLKNLIILSNGKNVYPEEIEADIAKIPGVAEVVVYAGESSLQNDKILIVAEIYPDAAALEENGVTDKKKYFEDEIKKLNAKMPPYKAVKRVKLRNSEFEKNTSKKIMRFAIDKKID